MWGPRTTEPPPRLCGKTKYFQAPHTWFTSSFFWPETWEKVWNVSHPYTFLFNSAKSCARSKARLWERDPGGIKGELRASLQDSDRPPSHGASRRLGGLSPIFTSAVFCFFSSSFFLSSTPGYSWIKMDVSIFVLHIQVRCIDVMIRPQENRCRRIQTAWTQFLDFAARRLNLNPGAALARSFLCLFMSNKAKLYQNSTILNYTNTCGTWKLK